MNILLVIAYDGTDFLGWQSTETGQTIEGELKKVLERILQQKIALQAASRTDAGVHAAGQIVNFHAEKQIPDFQKLMLSLNQMLPKTIRVIKIKKVPIKFHPTVDAIGKEYHYTLTKGTIQQPFDRYFAWHIFQPLNLGIMEKGTQLFLGSQDFSACANKSADPLKNPFCTLYSFNILKLSANKIRLTLHGNRFLYKMVRNLVGTIVDLGLGKLSLKDVEKLLSKKQRLYAGITAPAKGLLLKKVHYF